MKKLKYYRIREEPAEPEGAQPKVRYAEILQPETDWVEEISPPKVNGISHEHRDHG